jgi:hypothetical protein
MRPFARRLLLLAGALLSVLALPSAAGTPHGRSARTASPIGNFAMDGPTVAYSTDGGDLAIFTWNVLTGHKTHMSGPQTRAPGAITGLAVAGKRVAWIGFGAGVVEHLDMLFTASATAPKERVRARAQRYVQYDPPKTPWLEGAWMQGLVGSGDVLALSRWSTGPGGATLPGGGLDLIAAGHLRRIVAGTDGIVAQSADSGRIAVLRPAGVISEPALYSGSSVGIYNARGRLLRELRPRGIDLVKPSQGRMAEIVLKGDYLAVLTVQPRLELYNWRSGRLLHNWRLPRGAAHLDVYGQVATYLVTRGNIGVLRLRQLQTGRDVAFRKRQTTGFLAVGIEKPGLAYAWNTCNGTDCHGVLSFVPMARVLAAVSRRGRRRLAYKRKFRLTGEGLTVPGSQPRTHREGPSPGPSADLECLASARAGCVPSA